MPRFLVTTSKGLENLLEAELKQLSITDMKMSVSSIWFEGTLEQAYKVCYCSRLANKVLLELGDGDCKGKEDLYKIAADIDWTMHFSDRHTFKVEFNGTTEKLNNTQFSAQVVKDAVVDVFTEENGRRPNVSKTDADIRIQGRLMKNRAHIFLDLVGQSLHQRGYRIEASKAPIKENLAAALVIRSGWLEDTSKPLIDYFCGSGTIVIEAAQMALSIPAQYDREIWGFSHWLGHNASLFNKVRDEYDALIVEEAKFKIYGLDINSQALKIAEQNARRAGVAGQIHFQRGDATKESIEVADTGFIISNLPYGERLEDEITIAHLYLDFGNQIKHKHTDWHLTVISSAIDNLRQLKLSAIKKYKVRNAALDCQIATYRVEAAKEDSQPRETLALEFQNRLKKNIKQASKLIKAANTECYRIYDADLPNYNVALDVYNDWLVIQEYAPPKSIPEEKSKARLNEVILTAPSILGIELNHVVLKTRQRQKGNNQYKREEKRDEYIQVLENGAMFHVNLHDYLDTGLFLDHRLMRLKVQQESKGKKVLNLFSYTCSVSVHAAVGGADQVTSVDLSQKYLDWGKRNFELNKIDTRWHPFIAQDGVSWLKANKDKFDLIFIDPPSFSNSKKLSNDFDVQSDYLTLLTQAKRALNAGGTIYFSNNLRSFKFDDAAIDELGLQSKEISSETLPFDFKRRPNIRRVWQLSLK